MKFVATAYGPPWNAMEGGGNTSTGVSLPKTNVNKIIPIVAADPHVLPYGTKVKFDHNPFGDPNIVFTVADTGGAIQGNRIDFLVLQSRAKQNQWGRQNVNATIVQMGSGKVNSKQILSASAGTNTNNPLSTLYDPLGLGSPLDPTGQASVQGAQSGTGIVNSALSGIDAVGSFFNLLADPGTRKFAGMVLLGLGAITIGGIYVAKQASSSPLVETAAAVIPK